MNEESDRLKTELSNLLAIDDFVLVEDSYAGQKWIDKTLDYMSKVKEADVLEVIGYMMSETSRSALRCVTKIWASGSSSPTLLQRRG